MTSTPPITPEEVRFTLCFLQRNDEVLMLYRNKTPNAGKWNGVGGHIEPGEQPLPAMLREVREETGYELETAHYCGLLTWRGFEIAPGGLYLFTASAPQAEPVQTVEGCLEWKPRAWACTAPEVVSNLHVVLPAILNGAPACVYDFDYAGGEILACRTLSLPAWAERIA